MSISIPCLIKQPHRQQLTGLIVGDKPVLKDTASHIVPLWYNGMASLRGAEFDVKVNNGVQTISKLYIFPHFPSVKKCRTDPELTPSKNLTPSKENPRKTRRKKGQGNGYIYRRTITRKGKQYQEHYYRYRDESGKLRAKYIPKKLLDRVEEAESRKLPIADILVLLGGDEISRGEQSSTSNNRCVQNRDESDELISISRGEQPTPPSTKRRKQGHGTGYIECKPIKRSGKEYKQYWYHYEEWRSGDRPIKKSRYIPKRLLSRVEKMEGSKAPVRAILEVLGVKG